MKQEEIILLNHGSGGKLTHDLISNLFVKYFDNEILRQQTDSAILEISNTKIAFTTDSYVVDPIFFPGGNIGKLAVCGTVNDIAVSGATPLYISCGFIIEEGLKFSELEEIVKTMSEEAKKANVKIVTGDTKVVDKGKCDKIFINTSGVGSLKSEHAHISFAKNINTDDCILINGSVGDHGVAVISARNKLHYSSEVKSDCAPLNTLIDNLLNSGCKIKFMRDATRGGVATVLCELAEKTELGIEISENNIPVNETVQGMCELLGFDPLYIANEGKIVVVVDKEDANKALQVLQKSEFGSESAIIGRFTSENKKLVTMQTQIGGKRIVDMLAGEQLPRIC